VRNNKEHSRYEVGEWSRDSVQGWWAWVYVAGDLAITKQVCRKLCFPKGLCVTIESVDYIYAAGLEEGVRIGLVQYPPFPEEEYVLLEKAIDVGKAVAEANYQWSYSVVTPEKNYFFSRRKK
jgi:hypothetical protein